MPQEPSMSDVETIPHSLVLRAAAIARGPHACPTCESPTFAEPPIPWTDLRDYVVQCEVCERPISVRVDRSRVLRRRELPAHLRGRDVSGYDPVGELLDTRGAGAFATRLLAALVLPLAAALVALRLGAAPTQVFAASIVAIVPGALWVPAVLATTFHAIGAALRRIANRARTLLRRQPAQAATIEVAPGRWDQWMREERLRERERHEHPEAVLRELERVLDSRELHRVRALAERGEVPADHLDDLVRFRRTWTTVA